MYLYWSIYPLIVKNFFVFHPFFSRVSWLAWLNVSLLRPNHKVFSQVPVIFYWQNWLFFLIYSFFFASCLFDPTEFLLVSFYQISRIFCKKLFRVGTQWRESSQFRIYPAGFSSFFHLSFIFFKLWVSQREAPVRNWEWQEKPRAWKWGNKELRRGSRKNAANAEEQQSYTTNCCRQKRKKSISGGRGGVMAG